MTLGFAMTFVQLAAKVTFVLAVAWPGYFLFAKGNPRWQVWIWRVATVCIAALIGAAALPPVYGVPLLPAATDPSQRPPSPIRSKERIAAGTPRKTATSSLPGPFMVEPSVDVIPEMTFSRSEPDGTHGPVSEQVATRSIVTNKHAKPVIAPVSELPWKFDWWFAAVITYFAVVGMLILRLAIGLSISRRIQLAAESAPDWVQSIADQLAQQYLQPAIPILITRRLESPVLCGVLDRAILLPTSILESQSTEIDVRGAIAHEMSHAVGNDLVWDLWIAVVSSVIWPHPVAYSIRSAHRGACERVSDRMAADCVGDTATYQGLLARIALRVSDPNSNLGLAMARTANVRERLASIVSCPPAPRLGRRAMLSAVCVTVAVCGLGVGTLAVKSSKVIAADEKPKASGAVTDDKTDASAKPKQEELKSQTGRQSLTVKVIRDEDNQPIANARVGVMTLVRTESLIRSEYDESAGITTDSDGIATIEYPESAGVNRPFAIRIRHPGLVPASVPIGRVKTPAELPSEKTVRMERGKKIGGQVVDTDGKPVADARITINGLMNFEKTTADGTWVLDSAPLDISGREIQIDHPRFVFNYHRLQERIDGRYVLDPGLTLSGKITDQNGKPIPDTKITIGLTRSPSDYPGNAAEDGTYVVYALRPELTIATAEASGFAPQMKQVQIGRETKPLDFILEPGHITRFKVVNKDKKPLAGIRVQAAIWNSNRILRWVGRTDENGSAIWDGAPNDPVTFFVGASGYAMQNEYAMLSEFVATPRDEPYLIELPRPAKIEGTVTDMQDQNVPAFQIRLGRRWPASSDISWIPRFDALGRDGHFETTLDENFGNFFLRVEGNGFQAWTSDSIPFPDSPLKISVRLNRGMSLAGTVLRPDGQPAEGAKLYLATPGNQIQFNAAYRTNDRDPQPVASDRQGHFEFATVDRRSLIAVVHDAGYVEVPVEKVIEAGGIHLQKWARIEAMVRRGTEPFIGATIGVRLDVDRNHPVQIRRMAISGVTNSDGLVAFDRVIPGSALVSQILDQPLGRDSWQFYEERTLNVTLVAGETTKVVLGGSGATVKGRFSVIGNPPAPHDWQQNEAVFISPVTVDGNTALPYRCLIDTDGSFRIDGIAPGNYDLLLHLTAARNPDLSNNGTRVGRIDRRFRVVDDVQQVDLGVIEGSWFKWLGTGDKSPMFAAPGIPGGMVRLSEFRGRLVLINFWATWSAPSLAQIPKLSAIHQEFAADPRFQMLGLSMDFTIDSAIATVKKQNWPWVLAYARLDGSMIIPNRYDVQSIPENFLIDVDGTILYRGNDTDEISRLVRQRLAEVNAANPNADSSPNGVASSKIEDDFRSVTPTALAIAYGNADLYSTPNTLNGPGLALLSNKGELIRSIEDIGISRDFSGKGRPSSIPRIPGTGLAATRPLAIDAARERIYCCDTLHQRLIALDRSGRQQFSTPIEDLEAVAVDEKNGDLWCLECRSAISGELLILNANGHEKTRHPVTAFGIAYSPTEDAFWVVGKSISKINRDGQVLSTQPLLGTTFAFRSLAVDRERGGAWVLEDQRSPSSFQSQLWKASPDGKLVVTHRFPETTLPLGLICVDGRPWIAVANSTPNELLKDSDIQQFDLDGKPLGTISVPARNMTIGTQSGEIWLQFKDRLLRVDHNGNTLQSVPNTTDSWCVQILAF